MCVEELLGVLFCFLFLAERSNEFLQMSWEREVVRAHKRQEWEDEDVALKLYLCNESETSQRERKRHQDYDATRGFPGEDLQL